MLGYVYLIGSRKFGWYKIGKSSDAAIRVSQLGILLPFRVEVIAIWKASNHHELEKVLHEKYRIHHINGEWFGFNTNQVRALVAELEMAAVPILSGFSNIDDYVHDRDRHRNKKDKPFYSEEYREKRKQEAIVARQLKKLSLTPK